MKNIRIFLWVGLALILFVNFQTWQMDYAAKDAREKAAAQKATEVAQATNPLASAVPQALPQTVPSATSTNANSATATSVPTVTDSGTSTPAVAGADATAIAPVINVRTDVLDVDVSLRGGEMQR